MATQYYRHDSVRQKVPLPSADPRLLRARDVAQILGISIRSFYRLVAREEFPKPVTVGAASKRWKREWIDRFLNQLG